MTERKRARISAGEIAYVDEGDGPPVMLIHGFPTSADLWGDLAPLLAPRFRVVAPDLLGYGQSDRPDLPLGARAQAGYLRELLGVLEIEEAAAVGHGLGGGVAQLLAAEKIAPVLVLLDSVAFEEWAPDLSRGAQAGGSEVDAAIAERVVRDAFERGMGHPERLSPEDLEAFARPWRADPASLARAAGDTGGTEMGEVAQQIADRDVPMFVVWGEDDPFLPHSLAERLQDAVPGAAVALLPGCSHFVLQDAPETVAPMVAEFLRLRYLGEEHRHAPVVSPEELGISLRRPEAPPPLDEEG